MLITRSLQHQPDTSSPDSPPESRSEANSWLEHTIVYFGVVFQVPPRDEVISTMMFIAVDLLFGVVEMRAMRIPAPGR
jgi:hypothetical protein